MGLDVAFDRPLLTALSERPRCSLKVAQRQLIRRNDFSAKNKDDVDSGPPPGRAGAAVLSRGIARRCDLRARRPRCGKAGVRARDARASAGWPRTPTGLKMERTPRPTNPEVLHGHATPKHPTRGQRPGMATPRHLESSVGGIIFSGDAWGMPAQPSTT